MNPSLTSLEKTPDYDSQIRPQPWVTSLSASPHIRQTLVAVPLMARPPLPPLPTFSLCIRDRKCGSLRTLLRCLSGMHLLQIQEETGFLPWLSAGLACCPDCFVSGIFINSTHIVSDRITAVFVDRALWPPTSNTWCSYQTWHLFFIPRHWFSTH